MLNLSHFQSIFNEENATTRCRKVLDEISPVIKPIFDRVVKKLDIELNDEYVVKNYDVTLTTIYHDSKNSKYDERTKNTNVGKKYYVSLHRVVNGREYNLISIELNGMSGEVYFYVDLSFITVWAWDKSGELANVLETLPDEFMIFTGMGEKTIINKSEFISYVKNSLKSRKRPNFQIGISHSLKGQMDDQTLENELINIWEESADFRKVYFEEMRVAKQAYDALMTLTVPRNMMNTNLLGRDYTIEISALEEFKSSGNRQAYQLFDGDQMITKGYIRFMEHDSKDSPFQIIVVRIEGHSHIFTSLREVLGNGNKAWWIKKVFASHNLDNKKVMDQAMSLLEEHSIKTKGSEYLVGSFNNDTQAFVEGAEAIKKTLINAALLFAHASQKLELPIAEVKDVPDEEIGTEIELNFNFQEIYDMIQTSKFSFSKEIIRDLHLNLTALDDKHFVLLSGISGTGKTQLCRLYANAVYGLDYEGDNPYFTVIPVRPDWTDASALFGYYSSFEKRYVETEFLNVLLSALKNRDKPHFILLDEMNLARVEYYLSDYLSAVESRKEVHLHQDDTIEKVPKKLIIPPNVYILGTINVDETTHSISDKVLDRAFVMTLSEVDFDTYWKKVNADLKTVLAKEFVLLKQLHEKLAKFELHFGYRSMDEMIQKLYANYQLPEDHQMHSLEALDRVISEKVLTKVRGDDQIAEMLNEIQVWLKNNITDTEVSQTHVNRMLKELENYGATQFWS